MGQCKNEFLSFLTVLNLQFRGGGGGGGGEPLMETGLTGLCH